jgi:sortase A
VVLVLCGLALSAWALSSIIGESRPVARPSTPAPRQVAATTTVDATQSVTSTPTGYPATPKTGDIFGTLTIPRLKRSFPLVQGTGDEELKRGVGHMVRTVMPGEIGNCVISGHRDTVFTGLGKVEKGDRLIVETAAGEFTYEVSRIRIVDKEDRTVVVPTEGPVLTVSTCYPFRYVGSAPDRYVLVADLVANP